MAGLRRTAYLLCGDWHHAEDAVQTVLTKLYVHWERVERKQALDAYVRTMLVRATLEQRRRVWWRREVSVSTLPDTVPEPCGRDRGAPRARRCPRRDAGPATSRDRAAVLGGPRRRPDRCRLGCSEGTVKSQTSRGLTTMRRLLSDPRLEGQHS